MLRNRRQGDPPEAGLRGWWQTVGQHPVTPYVAILAVILSGALFVVRLGNAQTQSDVETVRVVLHRLRHDEQIACQIQARQLPAGRALVAALRDLYTAVDVPLTPAERAQALKQGRSKQLAAYGQLGLDLGAFLTLVDQEPQSVKCQF